MTAAAFGLTSGQKVGAGASFLEKALPKPKTEHPYIVGLILIATGVLGMIGSVTGQLPAMVAALFDPGVLTDKTGSSPGILGDLENIASGSPSGILGGIVKYSSEINPLNAPQNLLGLVGVNLPTLP